MSIILSVQNVHSHVHCFLWVAKYNKEEHVAFVDQIVHALLPDRYKNPELHNLVKLSTSRTCRKYKNEPCGFKLGKFFSKETVVTEPLPENTPEEIKVLVLHKRKEALLKVKIHTTNFLNLF